MTRLQKLYLPVLVIAVFGSFPLYAPLILQITGVSQNSSTILQAGKDLYPITTLTTVMIALLGYLGWYIDHVSLKRQLRRTRYNEREQFKHVWHNSFWQGIATELIGAAITAFLFGTVLLLFQQIQTIENEKQDTILQMGSPDNAFASEAVRIAQHKGWLTDGTLTGANLTGANLERVNLNGANFIDVNLTKANLMKASLWNIDLTITDLNQANLKQADLWSANLAGADLFNADLTEANLLDANLTDVKNLGDAILVGVNFSQANLQGVELFDQNLTEAEFIRTNLTDSNLFNANLAGANLQNANLKNAELKGTNLFGANLQGANLEGVIWSELAGGISYTAILPDGKQWTPDTDMTRFTDPNHPDFWQPKDNQ